MRPYHSMLTLYCATKIEGDEEEMLQLSCQCLLQDVFSNTQLCNSNEIH